MEEEAFRLGVIAGRRYYRKRRSNSDLPDLRKTKDEELVREARRSFRLSRERFPKTLYEKVIEKVTRNRKKGPFVATSGLKLDYYLNASTNFLDKRVASDIVSLLSHALEFVVIPWISKDDIPLCIVGPEMAGGAMVSQLCTSDFSSRVDDVEFVYMRKKRKTSGTLQQLEGPQSITSRDAKSTPMHAIWIDDCLSSGGSSVEGLNILKRDYNIDVKAMLFLIDRHEDRMKVSESRLISNFKALRDVFVCSIYDMSDIAKVIASE